MNAVPDYAPVLPPIPPSIGGNVLGVGLDLVHIPDFAAQLHLPGSSFASSVFSAAEQRQVHGLSRASASDIEEHLAARWAAKEACVKAWSQALSRLRGPAAHAQITPEALNWREIEIQRDRQGRPSLRFHGQVAQALRTLGGPEAIASEHWPVSLTHDAHWAAALVVCAIPLAPTQM